MKRYVDLVSENYNNVVVVNSLTIECSKFIYYNDARSAAFYAMGVALKTKEPVILMVPGEYVSSTYTAITEAWFQKANVIVIALYDKVSQVNTVWMDRCVINTLTAGIDEEDLIYSFITNNSNAHGPILLNIVNCKVENSRVDYTGLIPYLENRSIITYNSKDDIEKNIPYKYKYGVLSKYIGMSTAKDCGILLCTADCVLVDANIFRTRYSNANMKIIVLDDGSILKNSLDKWIQSNGWQCKVTESYDDIHWLLQADKQAVLIVEVK